MTDDDGDGDSPAVPERAAPGEPVRVVLVSGFLGAGKTTALERAARRLTEEGYTVGTVTNDQASGLVDTAILEAAGADVEEVPGGCFCCNFEDLTTAAWATHARGVDVLLCEPVGSCTDLVATVVNPLRALPGDAFTVAPLTVVLDPDRVRAYLDEDEPTLPEAVRYVFRRQVEEADLVLLNKADSLSPAARDRLVAGLGERVGDRPVLPVSAREGDGLDRWLSLVVDGVGDPAADDPAVEGDGPAAQRRALTDIDYDTYAAGEAALGWVNVTVGLDGTVDADAFRRDLMGRLDPALADEGVEVAHLKFALAADGGLARANLTATGADPGYDGDAAGTLTDPRLVVNARAVGDPEAIAAVVTDGVAAAAADAGVGATVEERQAFRPEYPEPTHRMEDGPDADSAAD